MNEFPLISVIIPAYNSEKWLQKCCNSVFCQTYPCVEIIIIDDGSTDSTYDIANQLAFSNENVRVIHTENGGVCHARNLGLETANGEYIAFLDSDDILVNDSLEALYNNLIAENADIAIGAKCNITSDGRELGCPYERVSGVWEGIDGIKLSLSDHPSMYAVWGKLYKRTAIGKIRFVEGKKVHEDSYFVFECLLKLPRVVICDKIVIYYRMSENSASRSTFSDKYLDILFFAEQKKIAVERNYPQLVHLAENIFVKANMALLWNLLRTNDPKYVDIEKKAIKDILDRKQYYRTAIRSDDKMFWIVTHRLYGVYKMLHTLRRFIYGFF